MSTAVPTTANHDDDAHVLVSSKVAFDWFHNVQNRTQFVGVNGWQPYPRCVAPIPTNQWETNMKYGNHDTKWIFIVDTCCNTEFVRISLISTPTLSSILNVVLEDCITIHARLAKIVSLNTLREPEFVVSVPSQCERVCIHPMLFTTARENVLDVKCTLNFLFFLV